MNCTTSKIHSRICSLQFNFVFRVQAKARVDNDRAKSTDRCLPIDAIAQVHDDRRGTIVVCNSWCMRFSHKSLRDILQHSRANSKQGLRSKDFITYARMKDRTSQSYRMDRPLNENGSERKGWLIRMIIEIRKPVVRILILPVTDERRPLFPGLSKPLQED